MVELKLGISESYQLYFQQLVIMQVNLLRITEVGSSETFANPMNFEELDSDRRLIGLANFFTWADLRYQRLVCQTKLLLEALMTISEKRFTRPNSMN